jgi:hypothetical protein
VRVREELEGDEKVPMVLKSAPNEGLVVCESRLIVAKSTRSAASVWSTPYRDIEDLHVFEVSSNTYVEIVTRSMPAREYRRVGGLEKQIKTAAFPNVVSFKRKAWAETISPHFERLKSMVAQARESNE